MEKDLRDRLGAQFKGLGLDGTVRSVVKYLQNSRKARVVASALRSYSWRYRSARV
ncbi:hypothetical protein [Vulcanisaeta souniana]|uniref:hypothetical protein n=1 Tax=Vulcanisaeta souniana TaxID=164452 RepID=UPI001FB3C093|nr:hypothetical protein [Vulcanisaeta souniana]